MSLSPGDLVVHRRAKWWEPYVVHSKKGKYYIVKHPETSAVKLWVEADTTSVPRERKVTMSRKLYYYKTWDGVKEVGTLLGYDGHRPLLKLGDGSYRVFEPKDVEEIVPYTVRLSFCGTGLFAGQFLVPKGLLKKGDLLAWHNTTQVLRVEEIDTRAESYKVLEKGQLCRVTLDPLSW